MHATGRLRVDVLKEIDNVKLLLAGEIDTRHIVKVLKYGLLSQDVYFIDMELCSKNLEDYIREERPKSGFECSKIWKIMKDVTRGVESLHNHGLIHRDLKPANSNRPF